MYAQQGDWLVKRARDINHHARRALILSVSAGGLPPYRVRWADDRRETLVVPGPDAYIMTAADMSSADRPETARSAETN